MASQEKPSNLYPHFVIEPNKKPNRLYAFPVIGLIIKLIMLIPVFIEGIFLGIGFVFFWTVNSCIILFTGHYWDTAFDYFLGLMRFGTKIYAFILGLTDTYPGFDLTSNGLFDLHVEKPRHPNRWLAIPLIGLLARFILLIPFDIFSHVMQNGSWVAMIASWLSVTFRNTFPESLYEFEKDTIRVNLASTCYITGISDRYPSFTISMNHQTIKILLIIAGALSLSWNFNRTYMRPHQTPPSYNYQTTPNPMNQRDNFRTYHSYPMPPVRNNSGY